MPDLSVAELLDQTKSRMDANEISALALVVISADGVITTSLMAGTNAALPLLGAMAVATDRVKAELIYGPAS